VEETGESIKMSIPYSCVIFIEKTFLLQTGGKIPSNDRLELLRLTPPSTIYNCGLHEKFISIIKDVYRIRPCHNY
jgi:hypothetical protein